MGNDRFDFIIVGSGFGGSVSAMRLAEKGYSVAVIEQGRRFLPRDFPKTNWDLKRFFWFPLLRFFGPQSIVLMKGLLALRGVGVGGGSLVYANTLMRPSDDVLGSRDWPSGTDWRSELNPHYSTAERMLGVTEVPKLFLADEKLKEVAKDFGKESSFHATKVAVYFGESGNERGVDPYFSGEGPQRNACNHCGACMIGCPNNSKNTLDKNYLYFAEKLGAEVLPLTQVQMIIPIADGFEVKTRNLNSGKGKSYYSKKVVISAGVIGTHEILFKNRDKYRTLPNLSHTLGRNVRTNGESLVGSTQLRGNEDYSKGVAIASAFEANEFTKIEAVRYPKGSGVMKWLAIPLTPKGGFVTRPLKMIGKIIVGFPGFLKLLFVKDWAKSSVILLVMQSIDQTMNFAFKRTLFGYRLTGKSSEKPIPPYLELAQKAALSLSNKMNGLPQNATSEVLLGATATAHILGGCRMGNNIEEGLVDKNHQVFGYPGLFVCDGSVIPTNLAVNPSLTITALAERFCAQFKSLK
ncbi:MAG: GMC family oxidoreductase [Bdellovibrionales bacterium]|nr:GMC family oxidoreductase [Bdellovibrionales bacterium]